MKRILKLILGFNVASLVHLIRLEPRTFVRSCLGAFAISRDAATPEYETRRELSRIPEISVGEILGERRSVIQLTVMRYEDGMLLTEQAMVLLSILVADAPSEVLEIGTYMGHTTRQMAENLPTATIHTVDLPPGFSAENDPKQAIPKDDFHLISRRVVGREFRDQPCAARIKQHFVDTAQWDFSGVGRPTFFFIDGSHTYEYCRNDSEKCLALCGGSGTFLWHDCDDIHPGVVKFVSEWRREGRDIKRISGTSMAYWKSSAA